MNPYEYETTMDCRDGIGIGGGVNNGIPYMSGMHSATTNSSNSSTSSTSTAAIGGAPNVGHHNAHHRSHHPPSLQTQQQHLNAALHQQNQQNLQLQQQQQQTQSHYDYEYQHLQHRPTGNVADSPLGPGSSTLATVAAATRTHGRQGIEKNLFTKSTKNIKNYYFTDQH